MFGLEMKNGQPARFGPRPKGGGPPQTGLDRQSRGETRVSSGVCERVGWRFGACAPGSLTRFPDAATGPRATGVKAGWRDAPRPCARHLSSWNTLSRIQWMRFSTVQCPRFSASRRSGVACSGGRLVTRNTVTGARPSPVFLISNLRISSAAKRAPGKSSHGSGTSRSISKLTRISRVSMRP